MCLPRQLIKNLPVASFAPDISKSVVHIPGWRSCTPTLVIPSIFNSAHRDCAKCEMALFVAPYAANLQMDADNREDIQHKDLETGRISLED